MLEKIINCYDSHTHFWATGHVAQGLKLQNLKSSEDIKLIKISDNYFRGKWLVGFGWNEKNWPATELPNKKILDDFFKNTPVFFSRVDGHASWLNSAAINELTLRGYNFSVNPQGGIIEKNTDGSLTGLLYDQAHINALMLLPEFTNVQNKQSFEIAQNIFNNAGFTHIRDMSMNLNYWQILNEMEQHKNLKLCVDAFVTVENINDLQRVLTEIKHIKNNPCQQMRMHGVKIFIDGSLGSKTAYLSENYLNTNTQGLLTWTNAEIKELIRTAWLDNQEVAIHAIGDEAALMAVLSAREVAASGLLGRLHLEHVQILNPNTINMMKPLHVTCYMQPCHWLSDNSWIKNSISVNLVNQLFQWELLRKNKIPFYFGSDSPIEPPSLFNTEKAISESVKWGVPQLNADWKLYHSHPDKNWCSSFTEIENKEIKRVIFNHAAIC